MNELLSYVFSPLREGDIALHRGAGNSGSLQRYRAAARCRISRGFLPWRLADTRPMRPRRCLSSGRHPQPFAVTDMVMLPREW